MRLLFGVLLESILRVVWIGRRQTVVEWEICLVVVLHSEVPGVRVIGNVSFNMLKEIPRFFTD